MHFLFLVPPISSRGPLPRYLWTCLKWAHEMAQTDASIAFPRMYLEALQNHGTWEYSVEAQEFNEYRVEQSDPLRGMRYRLYDDAAISAFWQEHPNPYEAMKRYIAGDGVAEQLFGALIRATADGVRNLTVVTWLNCTSLKKLCNEIGVRVVFNEFGPLRKPYYRQTGYFDFSGVNGDTFASHEWEKGKKDIQAWIEATQMSMARLRELMAPATRFVGEAGVNNRSDVGLALQVEDDSNAIAFNKGWTATALIAYAEQQREPHILRPHPQGLAAYRGRIDESATSLHFLQHSREIWTINSSVGIEALFWDRPVRFFGDCSAAFLCSVDSTDFDAARIYYFLAYLCPYGLIFNEEYYRWRLTRPAVSAIAQFHLDYYTDMLRRSPGDDTARYVIDGNSVSKPTEILNPVQDFRYLANLSAQRQHEIMRLAGEAQRLQSNNTAMREEQSSLEAELAASHAAYVTLQDEFNKLKASQYKSRRVHALQDLLHNCQKQLESEAARAVLLEQLVTAMHESRSWRVTRPLRQLFTALRHLRSKIGRIGALGDTAGARPDLQPGTPVPSTSASGIDPGHNEVWRELDLDPPDAIAYDHQTTMAVLANTPEDLHDVFAGPTLHRVLQIPEIRTALDVGSGGGHHARRMAAAGISVTCVDYGTSVYAKESQTESHDITVIKGDYLRQELGVQFDLVWASHVLEHQPNVGIFLEKIRRDCKPGGVIAITVPPLKHSIVGGHVSLWNAGLLLYNMALNGIDCSAAEVLNYGYNISVIVRNRSFTLPDLHYDAGDIDRLAPWLPPGCVEGFDGRMLALLDRELTAGAGTTTGAKKT